MAKLTLPIDLRAAGVDDLAEIKALHQASFRAFAHSGYTDLDISEFLAGVDTTAYTDFLLRTSPIVAHLAGDMVGSAGWITEGSNQTRRISYVFVRPMFTRLGIGTALVSACESGAPESGGKRFDVQATHNAVEFFERQGYDIAGYGVGRLGGHHNLAVTFMRKGPHLAMPLATSERPPRSRPASKPTSPPASATARKPAHDDGR